MQYTVIVRQLAVNNYVAIAPITPQHRGEGQTRDEAIKRLKSALEEWLLEIEITSIEVSLPPMKKAVVENPWAITAGIFVDESQTLGKQKPDPEQRLEELAGCLGQEAATSYDFGLKIGGLYEAR